MAKAPGKLRHLLQRSIFLKLFLIYLTTTIALVVVITMSFRWAANRDQIMRETFGKNLVRYAGYLIEEIGDPPDRDRAARLADELGLQFRVEHSDGAWATDMTLPAVSALQPWTSLADPRSDQPAQVGRYRGHPFFVLGRGDTRFVVFFSHQPFRDVSLARSLVLLGLIALILAGSYLVVRRLFQPINWLTEGAGYIAKANFDHQVPVRSPDELGQLTGAFNEMASRVRDMIRARERLLLDVSHELRSPLTRMKVALEMVQDDSARVKMQQEIRELEAMITELLESERLSSEHGGLTLRETDLVTLVQEVVESFAGQEPGVRVVSAPSGVTAEVDRERVRMALRNVVENALKHSSLESGPVEIRVESHGTSASVSIQDHGPGITQEEQALIFEPFYRVDKSRTRETGGYGLGLSLARRIMTAHGGDLSLTSEPGKGSTFTLRLPIGP